MKCSFLLSLSLLILSKINCQKLGAYLPIWSYKFVEVNHDLDQLFGAFLPVFYDYTGRDNPTEEKKVATEMLKKHLKDNYISIGGWTFTKTFELYEESKWDIWIQDLINDFSPKGLDIDWEFPGNNNEGFMSKEENCKLWKEVISHTKSKFPELELTSAVVRSECDDETNKEVFSLFDQLNIMCYDFDVTDEIPCHDDIKRCLEKINYFEQYVDKEKISVGLALYGRDRKNMIVDFNQLKFSELKDDFTLGCSYSNDDSGNTVNMLRAKLIYYIEKGYNVFYWFVEDLENDKRNYELLSDEELLSEITKDNQLVSMLNNNTRFSNSEYNINCKISIFYMLAYVFLIYIFIW